jgi:hypothetical protein
MKPEGSPSYLQEPVPFTYTDNFTRWIKWSYDSDFAFKYIRSIQ